MGAIVDVGLANAAMVLILAAPAAVLGRYCRRPALVHGAWLLVLLKLVAPPLVGVPVSWPRPATAEVATPAPTAEAAEAADETTWMPAVEADPTPEPLAHDPEPAPRAYPTPRGWRPGWRTIAAGAWLAGSAAWLACAAVRIARFGRVLRAATPAPAGLQGRSDALAAALGLARGPGVWVVPGTISPLVWAFFGPPRLLVPAALWARLDAAQRDTLLVHELAHLRRRDHWVRLLELAATALYWWNPVAWWARRALREAEEQCCDAWVVWALPGSARSYATALLETVDFLSGARPAAPRLASGVGPVDDLKRRLTMILRGITPRGLTLAGRLAFFGLAAALLPLLPTSAQEPEKPEPAADAQKLVVVVPDEPEAGDDAFKFDFKFDFDDLNMDKVAEILGRLKDVTFARKDELEAKAGDFRGMAEKFRKIAEDQARKMESQLRAEIDDDAKTGDGLKKDDVRVMIRTQIIEDDDDDEKKGDDDGKKKGDDDKEAAEKKKAAEKHAAAEKYVNEKLAKDKAEKAVEAEIKKARSELKEAEAKLREAAMKLAKLEGGKARNVVVRFPSRAMVAPVPPVPPVPPVTPVPPTPRRATRARTADADSRMEEMEKKLDKLMEEIAGLKKEKKDDK